MYREQRVWQWSSHIVLFLLSLLCVLPFILLFMASITEENTLILNGYNFIPKELSLEAYRYLWDNSSSIFHAYSVTIIVTVIGTSVGLVITSLLAYAASRNDYPLHKVLGFYIFFTLLFNGGLVPTYLLYTQYIDVKNTLFALIIPYLLMNGFNVMLVRTFYITSVPKPLIEAAHIDGAGEWRTFYSIVLPLSVPILATVGLLQTIMYWNDWFNGMIFITDSKYFSLQNVLNTMMTNIEFLSSSNNSNLSSVMVQVPSTGIRMAIAVIAVIPIFVAYPFFQGYFVKGIALGAVKG
ncbi:carbohydrate ABC transporter permease [Cohnella sp. WQ 127256]|uniref:carbohydrate ABC transporter permease n=1 Tax=Cohnella sp. WQ 127256 TaxID=2938790 RepID=UPI0021197B58|nr:carbohydrate ABC transporter permease [Cohnella sp. WQ 127256]